MSDEADLPEPRPRGRPSKYDPACCASVIEWGRQGKSRTWIAGALDIHRDTLYAWEKTYPEFADAMARAKVLEQMWWEDAGQAGMREQNFGQSVWSRSMAARFPDDWREKTETSHVGAEGGAIEMTIKWQAPSGS